MNSNLNLDLETSKKIRDQCVDFGYLTVAYFLHDDFNPDIKLFQGLLDDDGEDYYSEDITNFVKYVLEDSKI